LNDVTSILITGVGGQGIIFASRVLAKIALESGYEVKVSEVHGMAQRGGSVVTHLRFGKHVYSPLISQGEADFIIGFEKLEAMRCLLFLKPDGCLIINDQVINPLPVLLGKAAYPEDVDSYISGHPDRVRLVQALYMARELGDPRVVNIILLGVLAQYLDFPLNDWQQAIEKCVRPQFVELNRLAFQAGLKS
jgi:indolepyruvate ferredoxin oxidoreductase beta subunit